MDDIYENIEKYNPDKKHKVLVVFDDKIVKILNNLKLNSVITELLIRCRKLDMYFAFITQFSFSVPKNMRLNSTHKSIMKILKQQEKF